MKRKIWLNISSIVLATMFLVVTIGFHSTIHHCPACKSHYSAFVNSETPHDINIHPGIKYPVSDNDNTNTKCDQKHCSNCCERVYHKFDTPVILTSFTPELESRSFELVSICFEIEIFAHSESQPCKSVALYHQRKPSGIEVLQATCVLLI